MRTCPSCRAPLSAQWVLDVEVDVCPRCGGVFLDPGDVEARGWDPGAVFGVTTSAALGPSTRPCAVHGTFMERWSIGEGASALEIERASCCGGVFLDAHEGRAFAEAAEHATELAARAGLATRGATKPVAQDGDGTIRTESGAVFAAPPSPSSETFTASSGASFSAPPSATSAVRQGAFTTVARNVVASSAGPFRASTPPYVPSAGAATTRPCPRCQQMLSADRRDGVEIDVCAGCEAMFLDLSSFDARGIDTAVLFGMGEGTAVHAGASDLSCPRCDAPMTLFDIPTIAGPLEVERALCCGGLFLDGGEREPFVRAARRAVNDAADRTFAEHGEVRGEAAMIGALAKGDALTQVMLATVRSRVDGMVLRMVEQANRRTHHQRHR